MKSISYEDCLNRIYKLGRFGIKLELDTIHNILKLLSFPQNNYKTIHVAGTNGKGSTATYISSILTRAGFKTGLYTSPHLISFNERICVDGRQISDADVVDAYHAVNNADTGPRRATFFEIATAMAFYYFNKAQVDWAVIETGMGGRFDATNILTPQVSVITNLSIEHADYLGNTIREIANEKGGIIKPGRPVVTAVSQPSGISVLKDLAQEQKAPIYRYKNDFSARKNPGGNGFSYQGIYNRYTDLQIPLPGDHQKENMSLALAACELAGKSADPSDSRYPFQIETIRAGLKQARWPGRLEYVRENPQVIIDGAHNRSAAKVLADYLGAHLKDKSLTLVLGILDDKPYEAMLKSLVPCADRIILTRAKIDRSLDPRILEKTVKRISTVEVTIIDDVKEAVTAAMKASSAKDAVCVAGSLYVAGEAKQLFVNNLK